MHNLHFRYPVAPLFNYDFVINQEKNHPFHFVLTRVLVLVIFYGAHN